jgi:BON domain
MTNEILRFDGTSARLRHPSFLTTSCLEMRPHHAPLSRWLTLLLILAGMPIPLMRSVHAAITQKAITEQAFLSDGLIKRNIEDGFFWSPFVRSKDLKVSFDGGVATLTGTVGTWIAWVEADKDARRSGATTVLNRVKVKEGTWRW